MKVGVKVHLPVLLTLVLGLPVLGQAAPRTLGPAQDKGKSLANPVPTYEEVAPIVETNCTPCHNSDYAYAGVSLEAAEEILLQRDQVEAAVSSGYMPYGQPEWKDSPEGLLFLAWLRGQPR